jgi:hypothetical protein
MIISCGDTLLPSPTQDADHHLWVTLTEPEGNPPQVVLVNLTSFRLDADATVILTPGDHPFIRHKTVINYSDAKFASTQQIDQACNWRLVIFSVCQKTSQLSESKW